MRTTVARDHPVLTGSPYRGYVYAYPHKTAYRPLTPPRPLAHVWADEPADSLLLYVHVPFCSMRCGFCNLFTQAKPIYGLVGVYLDVLRRQAERVRACIPGARFARFAVGGGTPTYLDEDQLTAVFDTAERVMGLNVATVPTAIEVSPDTLTRRKVVLLKARGVSRVSIGIQSFIDGETAGCGRPQTRRQVEQALAMLADADFPTLNLDLIYGLPGQTIGTWLASVEAALAYDPEELFLYPLYVRPLTGLGRSRKEWDDVRLACYRAGRDLLLGRGYEQVSMRMFRKPGGGDAGPAYCCQEDGMIGLGCGARSYTRRLHYSLDYAVTPKAVKEIIADYVARPDESFAFAGHGFALNGDEQRRRYVLQSILNNDGLTAERYAGRFGSRPEYDFPGLGELTELGLHEWTPDGRLVPTAAGLERSDAIGPWLFSPAVRRLMDDYEPR